VGEGNPRAAFTADPANVAEIDAWAVYDSPKRWMAGDTTVNNRFRSTV
jgi:hypothetical protein